MRVKDTEEEMNVRKLAGTRPFTAALPMKRGEVMFEYACHEGNYGLFNMLSGARVAEAASTSGQ